MEASIDVEDLAGAVVESAVGNGANRVGDVFGFAHAPLREEAVGDALVVACGDGPDHVGADNAGLNFEHRDVMGREARGKELGGHGEGGFGHAVIAAIDRGGETGDGADEDDPASRRGAREHAAGDVLCEEVGAFQVSGEQFVEAFRGGVEDVTAFARGHACVVDEKVDGLGESRVEFGEELAARGGVAKLARKDNGAGGLRDLLRGGEVGIVSRDDGVRSGEFFDDGAADTAAAAGDEGDGFGRHK